MKPLFGGFGRCTARWRMSMENGFLRCTAPLAHTDGGCFFVMHRTLAHTNGWWFYQWGWQSADGGNRPSAVFLHATRFSLGIACFVGKNTYLCLKKELNDEL